MAFHYSLVPSPLGPLFVAVDEGGALVRLSFLNDRVEDQVLAEFIARGEEITRDVSATRAITAELDEYWHKQLTRFTVALKPRGTTFQMAVWDELLKIPYGTCISYGEIARTLGKPGASRAVGLANNQNPIAIVIPCHRVIGANGHLTGFGGGIEAKTELLRHEGYFML